MLTASSCKTSKKKTVSPSLNSGTKKRKSKYYADTRNDTNISPSLPCEDLKSHDWIEQFITTNLNATFMNKYRLTDAQLGVGGFGFVLVAEQRFSCS
jgi:hypothetical protein